MKKILRQGNTKKYRAKCPYCDTEFEYQREDIRLTLNSVVKMRYVTCPVCNNAVLNQGNPSSNLTTEQL